MDKETLKLKACPFCGSEKVKIDTKSVKAGYTGIDELVNQVTASVRCNVCHARGPAVGGKVISGRHPKISLKIPLPEWATTKDALCVEAVRKWNTRI